MAEKTNKIKTVTEHGTSSSAVPPRVLRGPRLRKAVQAGSGAAFLGVLPLCHFDLQSPGTAPLSEKEIASTKHVSW